MSYTKKDEYIVTTGNRWIRLASGWWKGDTFLADTTERTSPAVAHTRDRKEAVRLSKGEAAAEALQVKGKVVKA